MTTEGLTSRANRLMRSGEYTSALEIYKNLRALTNCHGWDWHIYSLEKKLKVERTVFLNQEFGLFLKKLAGIECIYVANLAHRPDRKNRMMREFVKFGISLSDVSFIEAVHGASSPKALKLFEHFRVADPREYVSISIVPNEVLSHDRDNSTVGVIGYLLTQELIIKDALINDYKRILVLDDDVFFSGAASKLTYQFFSHVHDWAIVHLGASEHSPAGSPTLQHKLKQAAQCGFYNPIPYSTGGSFAVAYDAKVFNKLLSLIVEYVGVFDRTILSNFYIDTPDKCFALRPAACCADVSESDIREARDMSVHALRMGWDMSRYDEYIGSGP